MSAKRSRASGSVRSKKIAPQASVKKKRTTHTATATASSLKQKQIATSTAQSKTSASGKQRISARKQASATSLRASVPLFSRMLRSIGVQLLIAGCAIALLLVLGIVERTTFSTNPGKAASATPVTIGIEHERRTTLNIVFARKGVLGYVSITNMSADDVYLSLPSSWQRTEVVGAPIASVTHEIPVFGFVRWKLPARAGIRLEVDSAPGAVFFDSVAASVTAIDLKMIDLTTDSASSKVILVQKQALVPLWGSEE